MPARRTRCCCIGRFKRYFIFPTDDENKFFSEHAELVAGGRNTVHTCQEDCSLQIMHFKNWYHIKDGEELFLHVAKLVDIFIRRTIEKTCGDRRETYISIGDEWEGEIEHDYRTQPYRNHIDANIIERLKVVISDWVEFCDLSDGIVVHATVVSKDKRMIYIHQNY